MPRLTPDRLPPELGTLLQEIRPSRRVKHMPAKPPANIHDSLMQAALVCPRNTDIAAFYFVSEEIFAKWRKADPTIDVVIAQARQADTQEVLQAVRKRAIEGSAPHAKIYLERMRADLNPSADIQTQINTNVKVTVLPTPPQTGTIAPPKGATIEARPATTTYDPEPPTLPEKKTPLFGGKDLTQPQAPQAKGLQRG